jgi:hypothetical protein
MVFRKPQQIYTFLIVVVLVSSFGLLTACGSNSSNGKVNSFKMGELDQMPTDVKESPSVVQEAYQFAVANPETLKQLPCYCGCGEIGHTSNYSCYVQEVKTDGIIMFDSHALGCSICVDITQDAMRLIEDGKSLPEIRTYIDNTYSQYGPSNSP